MTVDHPQFGAKVQDKSKREDRTTARLHLYERVPPFSSMAFCAASLRMDDLSSSFILGPAAELLLLVELSMPFVGNHWLVVAHFDKAHFNQSPQIVWTDGR